MAVLLVRRHFEFDVVFRRRLSFTIMCPQEIHGMVRIPATVVDIGCFAHEAVRRLREEFLKVLASPMERQAPDLFLGHVLFAFEIAAWAWCVPGQVFEPGSFRARDDLEGGACVIAACSVDWNKPDKSAQSVFSLCIKQWVIFSGITHSPPKS